MALIKKIISIYFKLLAYIAPKQVGKQAFYLFCIPFKAKLSPKQQAYLNTAEQKELFVEDQKVVCYKWGHGPKKILMVHGWQSNAYRWKNYIEQFNHEDYTVICFDAPGHGNSKGLYCNVPLYEKSLSAVVDHYGTPDSILSHSIGAFSSIYFLYKNGFKVEKFVSLASPFSAQQFFKVYKKELNLNQKIAKHLEAYFNYYTGHPSAYFSLEEFAPNLKAKTLIIHDKKDKVTQVENSIQLNEIVDSSELWATEGYGHGLKNNKVVTRVREFLES